ncbi:MAG: hypothetical protein HUU35_17440, partial [Armatimonadetes bacterium]|nr:hypothetical protein [Armatimonadota bacterium]
VAELAPADYRGVLGYLVTDDLWREPARWGVRVQQDARAQPLLSLTTP